MATSDRASGQDGRQFLGQLTPGSRIGRYQILGPVGRGEMGVYAAYHPDLDRRIALKVVHETGAGTAERRASLLREARAIARLSHPNVVAVHDAGTVGDRVFIAMEFVDGETLEDWLRGGSRTWRQILDVFVAAGHGLAAAHAAELVHRDFKPQNVMLGKDGSVRVMDFGLARMVLEDSEAGAARVTGEATEEATITRITKTGALLGTPAYMAPEQFRGERTDGRADQFSFCVTLHEALYGAPPTLAHLQVERSTPRSGESSVDPSTQVPDAGAPSWLRRIVLRGLAPDRDDRFESMEHLLRALTRGRTKIRRRTLALFGAVTALLLAAGALSLTRSRQVICKIPKDRLGEAWALNEPGDPRRESIHRAFLAAEETGAAETSWHRASQALDRYVDQWSTMYIQTCEAAHVRKEEAGDVLDLKMSCLTDNLDEVRALTDALLTPNGAAVGGAVTAAENLTPANRCADLALLRSAVPLPRDQRTLKAVRELQRSLRDARALQDLGNCQAAVDKATDLKSRVEAIGYKPLLGELLELLGTCLSQDDPIRSEGVLQEAFLAAEAGRDDATAAKAAANLIAAEGYFLGKFADGKRWARICDAILDRMGAGQSQVRAWAINNLGMTYAQEGDFGRARTLFMESIALKEKTLGKDHPDVAITLANWCLADIGLGRFSEALGAADRTIRILTDHGDPDKRWIGSVHGDRAEALYGLGRYDEASEEFQQALDIAGKDGSATRPDLTGEALSGLGRIKVTQKQSAAALPLLESALLLQEGAEIDATAVAETRFALARALWEQGRDLRRALELASAARAIFAKRERQPREREVSSWLATRKG